MLLGRSSDCDQTLMSCCAHAWKGGGGRVVVMGEVCSRVELIGGVSGGRGGE